MATARQVMQNRIKQLKRRRDFLEGRIADYKGTDAAYDRAEAKALSWAIDLIYDDPQRALSLIKFEVPSDDK